MKVTPKQIKVAQLVDGYVNHGEGGVVGFGGQLDIRPPYQREFVYNNAQETAVIDTVTKGFPLNTMYWAVRDDGGYEVLDGQQRTLAICRYVDDKFFHKNRKFINLADDKRQQILDYELTVYECQGSDSEKLEWFKTINIAGLALTDQELRNAIYSGDWVTAAKSWFSRRDGPASRVGGDYLDGDADRQKYLETAIKWHINSSKDDAICKYMADRHSDTNADELWAYFEAVIAWVKKVFPVYRKKEMKGLEWGFFYNEYKDQKFDANKLEARIAKLMKDEALQSGKGIYQYILTGDEKYLNFRRFSPKDIRVTYAKQKGKCKDPKCQNKDKKFDPDEMHADHIKPWSKGGKTEQDNCQMLCAECNQRKGGRW